MLNLIGPYSQRTREYSDEYYLALNYYALAKFPANNFNFRKVLHHEGISPEDVAPFLKVCLQKGIPFASLSHDTIKTVLAKTRTVRQTLY